MPLDHGYKPLVCVATSCKWTTSRRAEQHPHIPDIGCMASAGAASPASSPELSPPLPPLPSAVWALPVAPAAGAPAASTAELPAAAALTGSAAALPLTTRPASPMLTPRLLPACCTFAPPAPPRCWLPSPAAAEAPPNRRSSRRRRLSCAAGCMPDCPAASLALGCAPPSGQLAGRATAAALGAAPPLRVAPLVTTPARPPAPETASAAASRSWARVRRCTRAWASSCSPAPLSSSSLQGGRALISRAQSAVQPLSASALDIRSHSIRVQLHVLSDGICSKLLCRWRCSSCVRSVWIA